MDMNKLVEVLRATLQPDQREQAEQQLNEVHKIIGFTPSLLQVVMSDQVDMPVRQAGVIYLKNMVSQFWEDREAAKPADPALFFIHEQDRQFIRDNIIEAVMQAPDPVRVQLTVCISNMVKHDFPGRWPGIAEKVALYLQSEEYNTWLGALLCLYQLIKNFEYKKLEERGSLNTAMIVLLPLIHQRCVQLLPDTSEASCVIQKQILKCFYALVQYFLPLDLITREMFTQWMELMRQIADRAIPDNIPEVDEEDRPELIWWKCKKWAMHVLARVFERYGSPGNVTKDYNQFADWYLKNFSAGILQVLLRVLDQYRQKAYIAPRVLQQTLNYLKQGVSHAISWKIMKPHMEAITQEILFPLMCHTDEDQELWDSDPVEYIRVKYDVFEEFYSPVTAAQEFLHTSAKRKEVLPKTMGFVMQVLTSPNLDPRHKAGALHMIGAVEDILLTKKIYKTQIEALLVNHVFPEFTSEHGYLRARACWVVHCFAEVKFQNEANLKVALDLTRNSLCNDKELPVRVEAAIALQLLLTEQEKAKDILRPHIRDVILQLLHIIRETENDDLTSVMQKLVCTYVDEITPLAVEITTHLAQTFAKVLDSDADGSDEKAIAAMGILNTLDTIVTVMEDQKEILQHMEGIILDVVGLILQQNLIDFYEEVLSLVTSLTYKAISPRMWQVYPLIQKMFENDGFDYFTDMMPALHNYVTVDPEGFLADGKNIEIIYNMSKAVLTAGDSGEDAECHAAKMLEVILLQFSGKIDQVVPSFVELVLERLTKEVRTSELRTMCLQVVIAALYYNPGLLLQIMEKIHLPNTTEPITQQFLSQWINDADCFLGLHDRKVCVLGLCALMEASPSRIPAVSSVTEKIMPSLLILFSGLQRAYQHRAEGDGDSEDGANDEEYEEGELEDEEDDIDEEGQMYMEKLEKCNDDDDDDEEYDDEAEETALESYTTPLDAEECPVDEYQVFVQVLHNIETSNPTWFQALTGQLNDDQRKELQTVMTTASQRKAAQDSKKIEQGGGYLFTQTTVPGSFNFGQ